MPPILFAATAPRSRPRTFPHAHPPMCSATPPPSDAATARPHSRKRVRPRTPRPPRTSVAGLDAAISAGALSLLPELVARDVDTLSYGAILRVLSALTKAALWRPAVRVYDAAARNHGIKIRFTSRIYTDLFFSLMKLGGPHDADRAFEEWQHLVDRGRDQTLLGPRAYNFLFVLLSRTARVDEAMAVRNNCSENGFYLNRYSYNAFLNACAKSHRIADAFETLRNMAESNVLPDVVSFNVLIACCVRSGDLDIALGILHRMRDWGILPDVYSYNSIVNGLRKNKMLEEAFQLVALMEMEAANGESIPLITDIPKCVEEPETGRARRQSAKAEAVDKPAHVVAAAPLIEALTTARRATTAEPEETLAVEHKGKRQGGETREEKGNPAAEQGKNEADEADEGEEREAAETKLVDVGEEGEDDEETGVSPDLVTYNTLISGLACEEFPDFDRAMRVKQHMESRRVICNEVSYNALMAVAARSNRVQIAFEIYDEMIGKSLRPNCECFTTLITLCGRTNMIDRAFKIHEHMITIGIEPSVITYNALLTACRCSAGRDAGEAALQVFQEMRETPGCTPDVITYSTVIDALGRGGRFGQVRDVLDEMSREGVAPNLVTYTSVISALTRAGDLEGALKVLEDMEGHGIKPNVYTFSSLIHGAGRRGQFHKAFEMLQLMRERGIMASRVTYSMLLQLAVKAGERELLEHVIDVLATDTRLMGTPQLERILYLSDDPDLFVDGKSKQVFGMMNKAIEECIASSKSQSWNRKFRGR